MIAIGFLCIGHSKEFAADDFAKKKVLEMDLQAF